MSADVLEREESVLEGTCRVSYALREQMRRDQGVIYALCDPETFEFRYVGQTSIPLAGRLKVHLYPAKQGNDNYNYRWIRTVLARGLEPVMQVLDYVPLEDLNTSEIEWITTLRELGCRLTNAGDGGGGLRGHKASIETRRKQSETAKRRAADPVERARLSSISNGKPPIFYGEDNKKAKLTDEKVGWLRREARAGREIADLGRELNVSPQAAWYAATGRTWKHVQELPIESKPRQRLTDRDVTEIRSLVVSGASQAAIAVRFEVSQAHISDIVNHRRRQSA